MRERLILDSENKVTNIEEEDEVKIVKHSPNIECPHCQEIWIKRDKVTCYHCHKDFFIEH